MPSVTLTGMGGGFGGAMGMPKKPMGMDYSQKFRTGPANYKQGRNRPVGETLAQREGNVAARYTDGRAVPTGMPLRVPGFNTSGVGVGTRGYRGSGVIGSAAGAVGSSGVPTSQRGKMMKYGQDAVDEFGQIRTTDDLSDELLENNGLSQSWRYQDMGAPPLRRYTNSNPLQTQSIRAPQAQGSSTMLGQATGPLRRMGEMISKYLSR
jgi:hypothetical protein